MPRPFDTLGPAEVLFGAEVRRARCNKGLKQVELGRLIKQQGVNCYGDLVGRIEKGRTRPSMELAQALYAMLELDWDLTRPMVEPQAPVQVKPAEVSPPPLSLVPPSVDVPTSPRETWCAAMADGSLRGFTSELEALRVVAGDRVQRVTWATG